MPLSNRKYSFKLVLLGEGCVGKTSLVVRYQQDVFTSDHKVTIQASFVKKDLELDGHRVEINLWDTAGQEKFHALCPLYYRDSDAAILVYDITDQDSFNRIKIWVKELRKSNMDNTLLFIVANKIDLHRERTVNVKEAEEYVKEVNGIPFNVSAKNNVNVTELFETAARRLLDRKLAAEATKAAAAIGKVRNGATSSQPTSGGRIRLVDDDNEASKQKSCSC